MASAYAAGGDAQNARAIAEQTLRLAPADSEAKRLASAPSTLSEDFWIDISLHQYQNGDYPGCIAAAKQALKIKPDSARAYTNLGAGYAGLRQWDLAIRNEREAVRIDPTFKLPQNNLALYTKLAALNGLPPTLPKNC